MCLKKVKLIIASIVLIVLLSTVNVFAEKCEHEWSKIETIPSTPFQKGSELWNCDLCDALKTVSIPKRKMKSYEKKAYRIATAYLKAAKRYDWEKMNSLFAKSSSKYGYPTVEACAKYYRKYNKAKLKWKFLRMKGNSKKMIFTVKVTRPDLYKIAYKSLLKELKYDWNHGLTDGEAGNRAVNVYEAKLKKGCKKTRTENVKFTVIKKKGKWKLKAKTKEMVDVATAYYNQAMDDAVTAFHDYVYGG